MHMEKRTHTHMEFMQEENNEKLASNGKTVTNKQMNKEMASEKITPRE